MDTGVDGSSQQAKGATSPRSHGSGKSPSHSARTRTGRDGELQEAAIDLQMITESEALLVEEALIEYFQGEEFREEAKMLSELASTRTFHCDGCGRNDENTMYSYDAGLETPTIDLCVECFDRGCPPEGWVGHCTLPALWFLRVASSVLESCTNLKTSWEGQIRSATLGQGTSVEHSRRAISPYTSWRFRA